MTTTGTDFDPDFAGPADWAALYRACRLQVVPGYIPGEPKKGSWKRPRLPEWRSLQERLIDDAQFARLYGPGGKYVTREQMGIITGPCSGNIIIIDLDDPKGPQPQAWWRGVLAVHNNELETVEQRTGGGGRQKLFRARPDWNGRPRSIWSGVLPGRETFAGTEHRQICSPRHAVASPALIPEKPNS